MAIKMTRNEFYAWVKQRVQWVENEMLNPHNPDIADSEVVEVLPWTEFVSLIYQITEGEIVLEGSELNAEN